MTRWIQLPLLLLLPSVAWAEEPRGTIEGWGTVFDPKEDCRFEQRDGVLQIGVPATLHDLNPRNGALSSPRVLREIEGDFTVTVRVSGAFQPGLRTTAPKSHPFNSAGMLVWADARNYVRMERNVWISGNRLLCYPPLFEVYSGGEYQKTNPAVTNAAWFRTVSTSFRFERKGKLLSGYVSQDGTNWQLVKSVEAQLPAKVQVGVAAVNTSDRPLVAHFDQFKIDQTAAPGGSVKSSSE